MRGIADEDVLRRLQFDNPWWALRPDSEVRFRQPPRRVFFQAFSDHVIEHGHGALVLVGPMRAGKTVMLRQMVAKLIQEGTRPTAILYVALTTPSYTLTRLTALFELFRERHRHGKDEALFVFFDEAEYAAGWDQDLTRLVEAYPRARFVAAVSAGAPALVTGERSADGSKTVFVLPPLTFLEFLRFRGSEEKLFGPQAASIPGRAIFRDQHVPALNSEFVRYVNFGGFPEGILLKSETAPAPTFVRDHLADRILHRDVAGLFGISNIQEVNRLFAVLVQNTAAELGIEELAKETGIAKNTVRKYLDYLENAFLIRRLGRVDKDAKPYKRAVAFKVLLTTPVFHTALFGPADPDDDVFSRLVETALAGQWLGTESAADLAYAGWRSGRVDLLASNRGRHGPDLLFEIDWNDHYGRPGTRGPESIAEFARHNKAKAQVTVLTRSIARPGVMRGVEIKLVPVALYCYLLVRDRLARRIQATRAQPETAIGPAPPAAAAAPVTSPASPRA